MQDNIDFNKPFEFDEQVASCFDNMLSRSIPDYETMRSLVYKVGRNFVDSDSTIIDIGSSLGRGYQLFAEHGINVISCDVSEQMIQHQRNMFGNMRNVDIRLCDVVSDFPKERANLVLSILVLQFIPIENRQKVVQSIYESLHEGGGAVIVEKVIGSTVFLDDVFVREYYGLKSDNGYTESQISAKRSALEFKMQPLTEEANKRMLLDNGFSKVETFWRFLNFVGFVAVK